jgi:hypothetical protein
MSHCCSFSGRPIPGRAVVDRLISPSRVVFPSVLPCTIGLLAALHGALTASPALAAPHAAALPSDSEQTSDQGSPLSSPDRLVRQRIISSVDARALQARKDYGVSTSMIEVLEACAPLTADVAACQTAADKTMGEIELAVKEKQHAQKDAPTPAPRYHITVIDHGDTIVVPRPHKRPAHGSGDGPQTKLPLSSTAPVTSSGHASSQPFDPRWYSKGPKGWDASRNNGRHD